jgi:hypothetical protein
MARVVINNKKSLNKAKKRPGIYAKTKQSTNKNSKHYDKPYIGQGR